MAGALRIRPVQPQDAAAICAIYNHYIEHTTITFEQDLLDEAAMAGRIADVTQNYPWLIAELQGELVGYAYATRWRSRAAYDQTAESTIYLAPHSTGRGLGQPLYQALLQESRARGLHVMVGCIALPNPGSVALHERCGFRKAAHFTEVGRKFGQWIDVGFWEVVL